MATSSGRAEVALPDPLPPVLGRTPFPEDDVEATIYSYHLRFFKRTGRWPNSIERKRAFGGATIAYDFS